MPNMIQAGTYSAVTQYLKAIKEAGTDETDAVAKLLHEMKVDDLFARDATVGANGRLLNDMYLMEVKKPADSKEPWTITTSLPPFRARKPTSNRLKAAAPWSASDGGCHDRSAGFRRRQ
ncbi:branched-chain amino acid ABC transporter substrate-binding protein [Nitratireductor aquibiodomus RA22]|uniref:Branched-chain amino acid ABC transporter substrate-binding protein n=1 Tax=Nitratireductor aquibiodomus RA22 TaxID=1189611 RepID=I5C7X1_9HYPH|nr:branched-chain amino acid ABC transporter substrate-binding protein [Nitratireductor aquibiodomus RA22]